jgi:hydrocephalus-inducing protein
LGTVRTHVVRATNTGWFPVSFSIVKDHLSNQGFHIELDRCKNLPGAPDHETIDFIVSFDPRGANLSLETVNANIPINIVGGPQVCIELKANVTMPDMQISKDILDFTEVACGECKVITVQLHNHKHVPCQWNSIPTDKDKKKEAQATQIDKHMPMHLRRKARQESRKPRTFEMMPPTGSLMPGQRMNVQVKFMPTEERLYEQRIAIRLSQSSQRIMILCQGQGQEPQVQFDSQLVEFGPILPHSNGDEHDIVIKNPCAFPIEVYNLEFDRAFLEEEKILRLMKGYDEFNTILLPPRTSGEKLPQELLDYYEEQMKKLEEAESVREAEKAAEGARLDQEEGTERDDGEEASQIQDRTPSEITKTENMTLPTATTGAQSRASEEADAKSVATKDDSKEDKSAEIQEETDDKNADTSSSIGVGDLEITPVSAAIARHLGIDLSPEGKAARNRRGIAVIVHGTPQSGKTTTSVTLAKRYEAALLTVDAVVMEAISNGNTPAGLKAREMCSEAGRRKAEELKALEGDSEAVVAPGGDKSTKGGLSVEALTAHTQGTGMCNLILCFLSC